MKHVEDNPYIKVTFKGETNEYIYATTSYLKISEAYQANGIIVLLKDFYDEYGLDKTVKVFKAFLEYAKEG